jgi:hypothetical protein
MYTFGCIDFLLMCIKLAGIHSLVLGFEAYSSFKEETRIVESYDPISVQIRFLRV